MKGIFCILTLLTIVLLTGCVSVDYIGNCYPPTTFVHMYFEASEIPPGYIKMGEATATLSDEDEAFAGTNAVNDELKKKAMEVGADAILIVSNSRVNTGVKTVNSYDTSYESRTKGHGHADAYVSRDGRYADVEGSHRSKTRGHEHTTGEEYTYNTTSKVVQAVFYKYVGTEPYVIQPAPANVQ